MTTPDTTTIPHGAIGSYVHYDAWGWGTGIVTQILPGSPDKVYVRFVSLGATVRVRELEPATPQQITAVEASLPKPGTSWLAQ